MPNTMTSKANFTTFNQLQLRPLVCLVNQGSDSGSTGAYPWLWSEETLPAYLPVCKFDLILPIFSCS